MFLIFCSIINIMKTFIIKYSIIAAVVSLMVLGATIAKAEEVNSSNTTSASAIKNAREKMEIIREKANVRIGEFKEKIQTRREETKEKIEVKKRELKERTSRIKDEKKRNAADKIFNQLNHINEQWVKHFENMLSKLEEILTKVESRAAEAAAGGKDVSKVNSAITAAKTAIANAKSAVEIQAGKVYSVATSSVAVGATSTDAAIVSQLRGSFKSSSEQLRKDLFNLRDGVMKEARQAVHNAFKALRGVKGIENATSTIPTTTTTATSSAQ